MNKIIYDNEKWWQENGSWWANEVWERRKRQPLYGIQEVVLSNYFSNIPPSKVLEFGVGFGRHFDYLSKMDNLDMYGVDQSPTMLQSLLTNMNDPSLMGTKIFQIEPRQRLPFPDKYFDVTYTVSVLIHVAPEHLKEILSEIIRVTKHAVLHWENTAVEEVKLTAPDHNGCWAHPLLHAYEAFNLKGKVLTKAADYQDFYFIPLSDQKEYQYLPPRVMLERLRLIDQRIRPQIVELEHKIDDSAAQLRNVAHELGATVEQLEESRAATNQLQDRVDILAAQNTDLEKSLRDQENQVHQLQRKVYEQSLAMNELSLANDKLRLQADFTAHELAEIRNSLSWKVMTKLRTDRRVRPLLKPLKFAIAKIRQLKGKTAGTRLTGRVEPNYIKEFRTQLQSLTSLEHVAIHHPDWLGVSNSTADLFDNVIGLREIYGNDDVEIISALLANSGIKRVIFSGLAEGHELIIRRTKELNPAIRMFIYWHGNTTQYYEDYSWYRINEVILLCKDGLVEKWGFAKKSMAELYREVGLRTAFVMNYVSPRPGYWKKENDGLVKIGLYASGNYWNKNAFNQIAAVSLLDDNVLLRATPSNDRMKQFADQVRVAMEYSDSILSREQILQEMSENAVNLYVTFTECSPLVPIESLSVGVPCLTGPNHTYFVGTELEKHLVVQRPDDPVEISAAIRHVLNHREEIMELYLKWVQSYNEQAKQSVKSFLEG